MAEAHPIVDLPHGGIAGIYLLEFPDGRFYIGASIDVRRRILAHISVLRRGRCRNPRLQRGWNRHQTISAKQILVCRKEDILLFEQICLDGLKPGLNLSPLADCSSPTKETRAKISKSSRGNKNRLGAKMTEGERIRLSEYMRGNKYRSGSKLSANHKNKISVGLMGNKNRKGQTRSPEERAKLTASLKVWWAKRKGVEDVTL